MLQPSSFQLAIFIMPPPPATPETPFNSSAIREGHAPSIFLVPCDLGRGRVEGELIVRCGGARVAPVIMSRFNFITETTNYAGE